MKQAALGRFLITTSAVAVATLFSVGWSEQHGVSLSVESAQARVGRPLTPVSVAGVARRQNRRAAYGAGWADSQPYWGARSYVGGYSPVGAAAVGAAAVGTAAAVGAGGRLYVAPNYYRNPFRADLSGVSWDAVRAYYAGGPWSGVVSGWPYNWDGWSGYAAQNGIGCTPGSIVKGGDGVNYVCQ